MKKHLLCCLLLAFSLGVFGQNCIDAIVYVSDDENNKTDTLFCKIIDDEDAYYTIDNGYAVSSLSKGVIKEVLPCYREMLPVEAYRFKGFDKVTMDYFNQNNTVGAYLRKATVNIYIATGLAALGGTSLIMGFAVFNDSRSKPAWIVGGGVGLATALFFAIRGWNQIYKAGKLLDLNNSTLYLGPTQSGNLGLSLEF